MQAIRAMKINAEPLAGKDVWSAVRDAIILSLEAGVPVELRFNGREVIVDGNDLMTPLRDALVL